MEDDEAAAGTSASARATTTASTSASLFKKRSKPRGSGVSASTSAASSPAPQRSARKSLLQSNEEDGDDDEDDGLRAAVLRTSTSGRGRGRGTQAAVERSKASALRFSTAISSLANSEEDDSVPSFALRKDAIARSYGDDDTLHRSLQQQATIGDDTSIHSAYSPAVLAELKASTSNLAQNVRDTASQTAYTHIVDPSTQTDDAGDSLTRMKFAADFAHDGIPSEAVINAAKERRRRAMADGGGEATTDEFISLRDNDPHPESRLQREEDDEGSGEDDFAEFTGAAERVALEKDGIEREKAHERERRREAMELDGGSSSDDSEREWERAQMDRVQGANLPASARRKHTKKREPSPFQAAAIPQAIPLPTLSTTSTRLKLRKAELQEAIHAQAQLQQDAMVKLEQLRDDEERNRSQTEVAAEREAWFREFSTFIQSMALFLEEKMPRLQDIELAWVDHLADRSRRIQKARADALTDELALFYGVPARSLDVMQEKVGDNFTNQKEEPRLPHHDGDALSEVRLARRTMATAALAGELSPADQANFAAARTEVARRATYLLDDVQAAEYREPAPRISQTTNGDTDSAATTLHPSSLVARFHRWRRMFPDEYHNAWGGLTLASVWDFWIRRSLCGWDALRIAMRQPRDLDGFAWYVELSHYAAKAATHEGLEGDEGRESDDDMNGQQVLGGDDEVLSHALTNTLVPTLVRVCEQRGFDPWNATDNAGALDVVEQMSYVLEKDNVRFQSLVAAFVRAFEPHIAALADALTLPPAIAAPAVSPDAPPALLAFVRHVAEGLLRNLLAWHRFVLAVHRPLLLELVDTLVDKVVIALLDMAQHTVGGAQVTASIASDLLNRTSRSGLLRNAVREHLQRFVQ